MAFTDELRLAVDGAISHRLPFVAYMLPRTEDVVFFSDPGEQYGAAASDRLFIVNSWCGGLADRFVLIDRAGIEETLAFLRKSESFGNKCPAAWTQSTCREDYMSGIDDLIAILRDHGGKTVISRTICGDGDGLCWSKIASDYFDVHPEAFRYIYYTPRHGCWLGASPELLLKVTSGEFSTMALAGTRDATDADKQWSGKNIAEQGIVRNYIVDTLYSIGLNPRTDKTETVTTGNIQHLRTMIHGATEGCEPQDILTALNPTPALAGYPLAFALENITSIERHPRKCYGGYVAITDCDDMEAYVNLRCVNFDSEHWCMYVGGGIMPDSESGEEWDETSAKSLILKRLIEDSRK